MPALWQSAFFAGLVIGALATAAAADVLGSSVFPDVQTGSYYDAAVGRLYGAGVIKGGMDGRFNPDKYVTRAEIAVMLDRALNGADATVSRRSSASRQAAQPAASSAASSDSSVSASQKQSSQAATAGDAGSFRFSTDKVSFPEGASNVSFSIQRYGGSKGSATVKYATADGTAKSGVRYNQATGAVTFADGETTKVISLKFINNAIADPNETFTVALSEPTGGAVIGSPNTVSVTILDNDGGGGNSTTQTSSSASATSSSGAGPAGGTVTFGAWAYALDESAGTVQITVIRKGSAASAITVDYATSQGTATSGINYNDTKGTIAFAAGETSKSFSVTLLDNVTIDGNKNLTIKLSNPTGGSILDNPGSVQLTVVDDEVNKSGTGAIMFSDTTYTAYQKDGGSAIITVYRRAGYLGAITVNYATNDSTAIAGSDYTSTSGTLTFAQGESNKTFAIPIIAGKFVGSKRVNLTLSAVTGQAVLGAQTTAALNIQGQ